MCARMSFGAGKSHEALFSSKEGVCVCDSVNVSVVLGVCVPVHTVCVHVSCVYIHGYLGVYVCLYLCVRVSACGREELWFL